VRAQHTNPCKNKMAAISAKSVCTNRKVDKVQNLGPVSRSEINLSWVTQTYPGLTNPNNGNQDNRYHDAGYQLGNSTQGCFIKSRERARSGPITIMREAQRH
ncbi:hypothetical protein P7M41_25660, partial [Vibrio parahaemolyticus]|nr:hypothetical protein [Vibrio parahaemolyticus]